MRPNYEKRNIYHLIYLFAVRTKLSDCQKIFSCSSYLAKTFDPAVARYKDRHHTSRKLGVSALQNRSGAVLSGGNQSDTKEMYCKRCYVLQSSHKWRLPRSSANGSHLNVKRSILQRYDQLRTCMLSCCLSLACFDIQRVNWASEHTLEISLPIKRRLLRDDLVPCCPYHLRGGG